MRAFQRVSFRKHVFPAVALVLASAVPARAQIAVFDPHNYSQNILTAARTLQAVNNQVRSLQNEATMLLNQAKNLSHVDFPEMQALDQKLQQVDRLMEQAQGVRFDVAGLDDRFRRLFPGTGTGSLPIDQQAATARARLDAAMAAYEQTMTIQAQIAQNVAADAPNLAAIVARSQGAEGALQVAQATNQLLALSTKQQFQIQQMLAAQYRADAMDEARRAQEETDAQSAAKRFLGSGTAYTRE